MADVASGVRRAGRTSRDGGRGVAAIAAALFAAAIVLAAGAGAWKAAR